MGNSNQKIKIFQAENCVLIVYQIKTLNNPRDTLIHIYTLIQHDDFAFTYKERYSEKSKFLSMFKPNQKIKISVLKNF